MTVIEIVTEADAWAAHVGLDTTIEAAARAAVAGASVALLPEAEIAVLLSDNAAVRDLNRRFRAIDKPTNVLSFPAVAPEMIARAPMLGDLALGYETCAREAAAEGKAFADHVAHLIVHGVLHLLGYDHDSEGDAEVMEALERKVLAGLGIADPYAEPTGAGDAA